MTYVVGHVTAVPTENREAYRAHVQRSAAVFKQYGALQFVECWGEDVPDGKLTSFPMAVRCQPHETVVFAWVTWASREARDAGMAKVRAEPRMRSGADPAPYDMSRMIHGGFEVIVSE